MLHVKICGITNLADALAAVEAGADALGFNFYERSPRYLDPTAARSIISELPQSVLTVGVFVNPARDLLESIVTETRVGAVQLHGDETPEFCASVSAMRVIKAFRGRGEFDPERVRAFKTEAVLLDSYDPAEWGGTGRTCDWGLARRVREIAAKLYLAGGLTPDNVAAAVVAVRPFAVDVCSGVERAPGLKDHALMGRFVESAKYATAKA